MPIQLHSQTGLQIRRNDKNGFVVVTLHYTADPRKRGPAWRKEAAQGLSPAKFEQEYEISYTAMMGEKVFPQIKSRRGEIVFRNGPYIDDEWPRDLPMWGGFDYGARNPSSFHVYTVVDGCIWVIWELYKPCKNLPEFAREMRGCPFWDQIRFIAADRSMNELRQNNKAGYMESVRKQFYDEGVHKMIDGNTDEQAWLVQMSKHWNGEDVTLKILESCPHLIQELEEATYVMMTDRQLETQNYKETLLDKRNHAMDDLKYFLNSRPSLRPPAKRLPSIIGGYSPWKSSKSSGSVVHYN